MPPDPPSPRGGATNERDPYEADEAELAEAAASAPAGVATLRDQGDVEGLLALAKAHRAGTAAGGRDMSKCLEAYRAAAELGSAEAEYAVALFHMNGGAAVAQDLKEGATRLRAAAEKGSVAAKVYLGNLYELGIHYRADAEKADVWYRNAGRGAHVDAEQGTEAWSAALAELGCARHVLLRARDPSLDEAEKARLLARAKAHGYGLRIRDDASSDGDRATFVDALAGAESSVPVSPVVVVDAHGPAAGTAQAVTADPTVKVAAAKAEQLQRRLAAEKRARVAGALGAFGYALIFALAGVGAGYAATLGARELIARGQVLPLIGHDTRLVFPIVLALVGVLPVWLVYKLGAVVKALVMGAVLGGVGWVAWGTGRGAFHGDRPLQALAFGLAGFLAGLFVLGLLGGAKQPRPLPRRS